MRFLLFLPLLLLSHPLLLCRLLCRRILLLMISRKVVVDPYPTILPFETRKIGTSSNVPLPEHVCHATEHP